VHLALDDDEPARSAEERRKAEAAWLAREREQQREAETAARLAEERRRAEVARLAEEQRRAEETAQSLSDFEPLLRNKFGRADEKGADDEGRESDGGDTGVREKTIRSTPAAERSDFPAKALSELGSIMWNPPNRMRAWRRERIEVRIGDSGVAAEARLLVTTI
jgi:hypothetical protein